MYKLTDVKKTYQNGRQTIGALQGVDLTINDGEWLAIQGPTGHGKTTLLQMLGGLDRPTSGSVEFDSKNLAELRSPSASSSRPSTSSRR
jgi:putative ABC transport system ATP-binding protein